MQVTILSTSDVHGYVLADDFRRPKTDKPFGLAKSVTALRNIQDSQDAEWMITVENGDFIQGSPLTAYAKTHDELSVFKQMVSEVDYDVQILGNHEFNYGRTFLTEFYEDNERLLNANILDIETNEPFIGQPYRIFEQDKVKVAVIGVTTQFIPNWESADHIQGLSFNDPVETVKAYVQELQENVDVIVVAYHGGVERDLKSGELTERDTGENQGYALAQLEGVDAVVTGHQHRQIATEIAGTPLTQPGYRGEAVGMIQLTLDDSHQITKKKAELIKVAELEIDEQIVQTITPIQTQTDQALDTPITRLPFDMKITDHMAARMHSHPYLELVNTVQMAVSETSIASTALFNNEVQGLGEVVTRRDIMTNYIYPNEVVAQALTGQDIKDALEVNAGYFTLEDNDIVVNPKYLWPKLEHYNYDIWSGIKYTFDISQPEGERVTELTTLDGQPIDMTQTYEVAMNQYRSTGAGGFTMFNTSKTIREIPGTMTDHLINYLSEHGEALQPTSEHFKVIK